ELGQPRPRIEVRSIVDEPRQHRVGLPQVGAGPRQPRGAAGICGHEARPLAPSAPVEGPLARRSQGWIWMPAPRSRRIDSTRASALLAVKTSAAARTPVY